MTHIMTSPTHKLRASNTKLMQKKETLKEVYKKLIKMIKTFHNFWKLVNFFSVKPCSEKTEVRTRLDLKESQRIKE